MNIPKHPAQEILDSSKLQDFLACERKFFFRHRLGWEVEGVSNHLHFGSSIHKAMEYLYSHNDFSDESVFQAYDAFLSMYREQFPQETDSYYWPKNPHTAMQMLAQYTKRYSRDLFQYEVIDTEISGAVLLDDDTPIYFRMDTILRDKEDGKYYALEHKTGSSTWNWEIQWPLSMQMGTYTHALYCLYPINQVEGVLINGLFFQKNKTTPISFVRHPFQRTPDHMNVWYWNALDLVDRLRYEDARLAQAKNGDKVLMAFPLRSESCTKYFGCQFHDFCCTWPNPLRKIGEPPLGFVYNWWDPRRDDTGSNVGLLRKE